MAMRLLLTAAMATLLYLPPPIGSPASVGWANSTNLTLYRITPLTMPGVANMDTADAAGDIAFGLSQLLLPFICSNPMMEHTFVWCQNRKWLTNSSDSTRQMVYRRFAVQARMPLGVYSRCNPDPKTGVFSCCSSSDPQACDPTQPQPHTDANFCYGSDPYQPHGTLFLNGTVLRSIAQHSSAGVDPSQSCCKACNDAEGACDGIQYISNSSGAFCLLIANGSLVDNPHGIRSTTKQSSGLGLQPNRRCWNRPPPPNLQQGGGWTALDKSFAPFCDPTRCGCEAAEALSVGWEPQPMCNNMANGGGGGGKQSLPSHLMLPPPGTAASAAVDGNDGDGGDSQGSLVGVQSNAPPRKQDYWSCKAAVAQVCGGWDSWKNPGSCLGCALGSLNPSNYQMQSCTRELIQQACAAPVASSCSAAIASQCKPGW
jgi:hypothetical protein